MTDFDPGAYYKQPFDEETITLNLSNRIGAGDSISNASIAIFDTSDESDVTAQMLVSSKISSPYIYLKTKNGTQDKIYDLRVRMTTTHGEIKELDLRIYVIEQQ